MTELKTLKELIHLETSEHHRFLDIDELKAEAVKWVKYFGKTKPDSWFIKHFFNLTEADLKEGVNNEIS